LNNHIEQKMKQLALYNEILNVLLAIILTNSQKHFSISENI